MCVLMSLYTLSDVAHSAIHCKHARSSQALVMETEFGDTPLTAAVQSEDTEMVRDVLECVKEALPHEKVNPGTCTHL